MGSSSLSEVFDPIRKEWVKATPEEQVRQKWILHMVDSLGFPKELFAIEKKLSELPHLQGERVSERRVDLLVYACLKEQMVPLLLMECKASLLEKEHQEQLMGYNHHVKAPFIALVSNDEVLFGFQEDGVYQFHNFLPTFRELTKWLAS